MSGSSRKGCAQLSAAASPRSRDLAVGEADGRWDGSGRLISGVAVRFPAQAHHEPEQIAASSLWCQLTLFFATLGVMLTCLPGTGDQHLDCTLLLASGYGALLFLPLTSLDRPLTMLVHRGAGFLVYSGPAHFLPEGSHDPDFLRRSRRPGNPCVRCPGSAHPALATLGHCRPHRPPPAPRSPTALLPRPRPQPPPGRTPVAAHRSGHCCLLGGGHRCRRSLAHPRRQPQRRPSRPRPRCLLHPTPCHPGQRRRTHPGTGRTVQPTAPL